MWLWLAARPQREGTRGMWGWGEARESPARSTPIAAMAANAAAPSTPKVPPLPPPSCAAARPRCAALVAVAAARVATFFVPVAAFDAPALPLHAHALLAFASLSQTQLRAANRQQRLDALQLHVCPSLQTGNSIQCTPVR